ncbi:flagellar hook-associated protein FlgL [Clostridium butyricum]|uniref:flagellar hook-associated protein FlgL n=1 Tax=Clostridium butyricum TaxID=1492 RepID=UPI0018A968AB|nr:flagellar hook-associated protein FlgL [Clostridium butyricum]
MTRITNGMLVENYMTNTNRNLNNMQTLQRQLSSGKEINRPSDNPYKASRTMQLYTEIDANKQYNENIKDVSNWLDTTDTALNQMNNVLSRMRELMVTAGNGAYGDDEKKAIQDEIKELQNQMCQIMNTNFDGAYIFGGTKSTSKPVMIDENGQIAYCDKNGNAAYKTNDGIKIALKDSILSIDNKKNINNIEKRNDDILINVVDNTDPNNPIESTIGPISLKKADGTLKTDKELEDEMDLQLGDFQAGTSKKITSLIPSFNTIDQIGSELKVEVSQGVLIDYNINAQDILEFTDNKTGKKINVVEVLNDIISNLGESGDVSKVTGEGISKMDSIISNLLEKRSKVGAMTNRMESAEEKNDQENLNMTDILSKTEDIDFTEKMMEYAVMQTIYMASLQVSAKILPTTILDYIR